MNEDSYHDVLGFLKISGAHIEGGIIAASAMSNLIKTTERAVKAELRREYPQSNTM